MASSPTHGELIKNRRLSEHSLKSAAHCLINGNHGRAFAHYLLCLKLTPEVKSRIKEDFTYTLREWSEELERANRFDDLFNCYEQACELFPECNTALNNMGAQLFRLGYAEEAACCFRRSLRIDPACMGARDNLENVCSHLLERWHFRMLNDQKRNTAFNLALCRAVAAGHGSVLDIGAGEGLLSMMAVKAGATTVSACEQSKPIYEIACDVLAANGMADKVNLFHKVSQELSVGEDISDRVSLVVTETVDAGLLGENILNTVQHAWQHLLIDDTQSQVIPAGATVYGCIVDSADIRRENRLLFPALRGVDLSHVEVTCDTAVSDGQPYTTYDLRTLPSGYRQLSDVFKVAEFNFNDKGTVQEFCKGYIEELKVTVKESGRVDAMVTWFDLRLDDRIKLNTGPESGSCWEQAVYPVLPCHVKQEGQSSVNLLVGRGDSFKVRVCCESDFLRLTCAGVSRAVNQDKVETSCDLSQLETELENSAIGESQLDDMGKLIVSEEGCTGGAPPVSQRNVGWHENVSGNVFQSSCSSNIVQRVNGEALTTSGGSEAAVRSLSSEYSGSAQTHFTLDRSQIRKLNDASYNSTVTSRVQQLIQDGRCNVVDCCHVFSLVGLQAAHHGATSVLMTVDDPTVQCLVKTLQTGNDLAEVTIEFECDLRQCRKVYDIVAVDLVEPCGILRQQILEEIALSRLFCLRPNGVIIPSAATVHGMLVESDTMKETNQLVSNKRTLGFNIRPFVNDFQMRNHVDITLTTGSYRKLSAPFKMFDFNFKEEFDANTVPSYLEQTTALTIPVTESGEVAALVYWFDLEISDTCSISTLDSKTHFKQAALMLREGIQVTSGQVLQGQVICRNSNFYLLLD